MQISEFHKTIFKMMPLATGPEPVARGGGGQKILIGLYFPETKTYNSDSNFMSYIQCLYTS